MPKKMSGLTKTAIGIGSTIGTGGILDFALNVLQNLPQGKDGGRVTPKGIGKAKRGFGRAMKRKR
jgi:hypothetical protein